MDTPSVLTHPATMVPIWDGQEEKETFRRMPTPAAGEKKPGCCKDLWRALEAGGMVSALSMNNKRPESSMSSRESGTLLYF